MKTVLHVLPPVMRKYKGHLELDSQTCTDLPIWLENFDRIIIACPVFPEKTDDQSNSKTVEDWMGTLPIDGFPFCNQIELIALPFAYRLPDFVRTYKATSQLLREKIRESQYLYFCTSTALVGDWAAIACLEALKLSRPYCILMDLVHHQKIRLYLEKKSWLKRKIKENITIPLMKRYHPYLIKKSTLGIFVGQDSYTEYAPFCQNPHCVYLIRTSKSDQIDRKQVEYKVNQVLTNETLRICYVGRADKMKGPFDWLKVISQLNKSGINFEATWVGDGPLLEEMKSLAQRLGINDLIEFTGFVSDPQSVLEVLRKSHIFLFCHKIPESPRCLIEALISGCPIVGYGSPYSKDLVEKQGGGLFVSTNDWQKLAQSVTILNNDREQLSSLIKSAALSGQRFDLETCLQERIQLIKKYLTLTN